jgi:hypothetical protein
MQPYNGLTSTAFILLTHRNRQKNVQLFEKSEFANVIKRIQIFIYKKIIYCLVWVAAIMEPTVSQNWPSQHYH